MHRETYL